MLPPSTTRPQRPSLVSISSSSHQPMGPPPEPSHPSPLPPPTSMWPAPDTTLSSSATAPTVDFENSIRRVREVTKHFFTPRLDSFYDTSNHILKAYLELPGVRREHLFVTLATSAITRHRSVNVWGISLSPAWLSAGAAQAGDGTASTSQERSSLGKTMHMSSGPDRLQRKTVRVFDGYSQKYPDPGNYVRSAGKAKISVKLAIGKTFRVWLDLGGNQITDSAKVKALHKGSLKLGHQSNFDEVGLLSDCYISIQLLYTHVSRS
ncbi:hypothetical protein DFH05DRAFT_1468470 [Lentinula detonsa]|uniref:Uncharacterized protein n=1 Tax=Lentinula detonsa TaxID=2804962 RepID=A0A9W8PBK5_9AGAR|nr:hypothetical protein DFH05DRAFT_1468470 [Lentinula detonsa]